VSASHVLMHAVSHAAAASNPTNGGTGNAFVFWICAILAVAGALGLVLSRRAVHSALWVAMTMISLAVLYVAQQGIFVGIVQVVVYTGAIMMLFLFVLMIVGVDASDSFVETIKGQRWIGIIGAIGLGGLIIFGVADAFVKPPVGLDAANSAYGSNPRGIAAEMFSNWVLIFEVTSALLVTAAVGAMVLAHRERLFPKLSQRLQSEARVRSGQPNQLPVPGVYARHNAVDTPAIRPDGTLAPSSVPAALQARGTARGLDVNDIEEVSTGMAGAPSVIARGTGIDDPAEADFLDQSGDDGEEQS
jgi:NADH-quinone oxidoreductase subunit J